MKSALVVVAALHVAACIPDRRGQADTAVASAPAESSSAKPRDWGQFQSREFGLTTATLRTACHVAFAGAYPSLHYLLLLTPASPKLLDPIREVTVRDSASLKETESGPGGYWTRVYGIGSGLARQEDRAFQESLQSNRERLLREQGLDTVFVISFHDSSGFRRRTIPVFRQDVDLRMESRDTLSASTTDNSLCGPELLEFRTWQLRRVRRPAI